jgi:branched-subunit amino acid transport protein
MSWAAILVLAGGAYLFKAAGLLIFGGSDEGSLGIRIGRLLPPALLTALIAVSTFGAADGKGLTLDARAAGIAAAIVAVWRRAPFVVVIVVGAAVTALLRLP